MADDIKLIPELAGPGMRLDDLEEIDVGTELVLLRQYSSDPWRVVFLGVKTTQEPKGYTLSSRTVNKRYALVRYDDGEEGLVQAKELRGSWDEFVARCRQEWIAREPADRKRAQRAGMSEDGVQVITLRRPRQQPTGSDPRPVDWSCSWMVDGHWHRYHTNKGMIRRWLTPYVKGPPDKPLKFKEHVYAWRR